MAFEAFGNAFDRPGGANVARVLDEVDRECGLLRYRTFGYGHSFGVLCHYYGREAGLELREDIETVLEPDMVVSMEPMIMVPEGRPGAGGYREHDILVITPDGNENITGFPYRARPQHRPQLGSDPRFDRPTGAADNSCPDRQVNVLRCGARKLTSTPAGVDL